MEKTKLSKSETIQVIKFTNTILKTAQKIQEHILTGAWQTAYYDSDSLESQVSYIKYFIGKRDDVTEVAQ